MQLRLGSSPHYRLSQRVKPVEAIPARPQAGGEEHLQRPANRSLPAGEPTRPPAPTASDNARHEYYYSRVEAVAGHTANALKSYSEVEATPWREQLQAQLGLDIYV
jgi:hypothetical protein